MTGGCAELDFCWKERVCLHSTCFHQMLASHTPPTDTTDEHAAHNHAGCSSTRTIHAILEHRHAPFSNMLRPNVTMLTETLDLPFDHLQHPAAGYGLGIFLWSPIKYGTLLKRTPKGTLVQTTTHMGVSDNRGP